MDGNSTTGRQGGLPGGIALVALAAFLWGADGVFRTGVALELPPATVVFWEHAFLVAITVPALRRGLRAARDWRAREWTSALLIGAGASATATALFTSAFRYGDPTTPLLLQKLQPILAIVAARLLLGERLRPRFGMFLAAALLGGWLITFADPLRVAPGAAAAGLFALGAAALWAMGTVLGRHMTAHVPPRELTALRFGIGLPAAAVLVMLDGGGSGFAIGGEHVVPLLVLALVPGYLALSLYYRGLRSTPASIATLAELAFPLSAVTLGYLVFGNTLAATQWVGIALLSGTLVAMSFGARAAGVRAVGVEAPTRLEPAEAHP